MKYCYIQNCSNNRGIRDENTLVFRLPSKEPLRRKWIELIKATQNFDERGNNKNFYICENHFDKNEIKRGKKNKLDGNAIPRYFQSLFECLNNS